MKKEKVYSCPVCCKHFKKSEIKRIYGKESHVYYGGYCSAKCYTDDNITPTPRQSLNDELSSILPPTEQEGLSKGDRKLKGYERFKPLQEKLIKLRVENEALKAANKELYEALSEIIKWDSSNSWVSHIDSKLVEKAKETLNNNPLK